MPTGLSFSHLIGWAVGVSILNQSEAIPNSFRSSNENHLYFSIDSSIKHHASSQAFDMECYEKKKKKIKEPMKLFERSLVFLTKNWKYGKYYLELEVKLTENFHVLFFLHLTNPTITKEVQTSSMAFPYIYSLLNESFHFLFYICSFV